MSYNYLIIRSKLITGIILLFLTAGLSLPEFAGTQPVNKDAAAGSFNINFLLGMWERSDGSYVLEIKDVRNNGTLTASYYNPKSINVSRSQWQQGSDALYLLVELRDVNYPGSTYTLRYDAGTDRLVGKYFQAMDKITYDIEFLRKK
ncbi:hypothetical protein [Desulfobacter sp. UBA2225]|uniref:hypothetical protein n=1 Tax=Desulfobacter sp. UBA2225 TaxID=1961413 RepID=UPI00257BBB2E|nr:hypothetical protein [Desulfobacter sp. UBA2225]